jgi:hypothetical protein
MAHAWEGPNLPQVHTQGHLLLKLFKPHAREYLLLYVYPVVSKDHLSYQVTNLVSPLSMRGWWPRCSRRRSRRLKIGIGRSTGRGGTSRGSLSRGLLPHYTPWRRWIRGSPDRFYIKMVRLSLGVDFRFWEDAMVRDEWDVGAGDVAGRP